MNTPNPLIPQGSLDSLQSQKRSATKLVVSMILGAHGVVLGGLLFLGCSKDDAAEARTEPADSFSSLAVAPATNEVAAGMPFGDLGAFGDEALQVPAPDTNLFSGFPPLPGDAPVGGVNGGGVLPPFPGDAPIGGVNGAGSNVVVGLPPDAGRSGGALVVDESSPGRQDYVVRPNDNFWTIARDHKIKASDITAANPGVDSRKLKVGQVIKLPGNVTAAVPKLPEGGPTTAAGSEVTYKVKSGDTLTRISRDYGVSVKAIQQANGIRGSLIKVGQELVIPVQSASGGR